ncbi:MAG: methyltransferase domain-containing protein [Chitinophagaceae bacterium]|nr:MAG: methyltransferase domain-containing protein [Chitinophagaceae bacterium]
MGNNIFHFKAFSVRQECASMKVCTDSCLFAAWSARKIKEFLPSAPRLLDIGTGTGLLSLMIAQQVPVKISVVEIDADAIHDAQHNFAHSPWKHRIDVYHNSIQNFASEAKEKYDLIICNPPFFSKSLNSPKEKKSLSKHENNLSLEELIKYTKALLNDTGYAFIMLPADRDDQFRKIIKFQNLFLREVMNIHQTKHHTAFRKLYCLASTEPEVVAEGSMFIKKDKENYSAEFIDLLKPYYLAL